MNLIWTNPTTNPQGSAYKEFSYGGMTYNITLSSITYATDGDNAGFPNSGETDYYCSIEAPS